MSEYLNELRDSASQVIAGTETPATEQVLWPLIVELGWLLTMVPEELEGLGLGVQEACALHTELGRGLCQAPFLPAMLVVDALAQSGRDDRADTIMQMVGGECMTASLATSSLALDAQAGVVSGTLTAVLSADNASQVLLWTGGADLVALVPVQQSGLALQPRETWDTTRRLFDVSFDKVPVDALTVLAEGADALAMVARLETLRDFGLAADSVGAASALLDMTVEHLQTRKQFGRPLALFQALKHRCADMKTLIAGADALLLDSITGISSGDLAAAEAGIAATKAKLLACSAFSRVAEEALQLHGGIGMASEHPCHLYLKRAMLSEHLGSGPEQEADRVAANLLAARA